MHEISKPIFWEKRKQITLNGARFLGIKTKRRSSFFFFTSSLPMFCQRFAARLKSAKPVCYDSLPENSVLFVVYFFKDISC